MSTGKVVQVIGPVVDVEFPPNELPDILSALSIDRNAGKVAVARDESASKIVAADITGDLIA
jgi:F0F1-type ATP synthase beta subunit